PFGAAPSGPGSRGHASSPGAGIIGASVTTFFAILSKPGPEAACGMRSSWAPIDPMTCLRGRHLEMHRALLACADLDASLDSRLLQSKAGRCLKESDTCNGP